MCNQHLHLTCKFHYLQKSPCEKVKWSKIETRDTQYTCHFILSGGGAESGDVNYCRSLTALQLMTAHHVNTLMMPCSTPIHVPAAELLHVAASLTLTRGLTQRSHHTSNIAPVLSGGTCSVHYICYYVSRYQILNETSSIYIIAANYELL